MFRAENNVRYGVGTYVVSSQSHQWLIVQTGDTIIGALDKNTLRIVSTVRVEDPKWITRKEFDDLFEFAQCTLTDFTLQNTVGINVKIPL